MNIKFYVFLVINTDIITTFAQNYHTTMKKVSYFIAAAALCAACDNSPKFHVEGAIEGAQDSTLYLEAATLDGLIKLDSVKLGANGEFSLKADAPVGCPDFYILRIADKYINLSIDSTETVTVKASYDKMTTDYTVEGSENCQKIKEISLLQQKVQKRLVEIETNQNMYPGDILDSIQNIIENYKENIKVNYIYQDPSKAYAYYAVCQSLTDARGSFMLFNPVSDRKDVKVYASVATSWDANYPDAKRTEQLCNMAIKGMDNTATPKQTVLEVDEGKIEETSIIDVNLPDINSKLHSIKSLKGKVVMLDFTVFGAKESAQRTRLLREIYNKYKDRGFTIYQVSLDDDIHFWKTSVEHLPWTCVHETDGAATRLYGVQDLPTYFLINKNNEIVGRDVLLGGSLEEEIQKLL